MGVVPGGQSRSLRAVRAYRGMKLLQDHQTTESTAMKRAMVRFRGGRETDAMAFVEYLGVSQEDTMKAPLWRETTGRSLGSHDARFSAARRRSTRRGCCLLFRRTTKII